MPRPPVTPRPLSQRPKRNRTNGQRFPYDPLTFGLTTLGWVIALAPKLQAMAGADTATLPARLYATIVDHLFGLDDDESAMWELLMSHKPSGISDDLHAALAELTSDTGLLTADFVEWLADYLLEARAQGYEKIEVADAVEEKLHDLLREHDLFDNIGAVLDAD